MGYFGGWLSMFGKEAFDERPGRRLSVRPDRGNRAKVKAARKAARRNR